MGGNAVEQSDEITRAERFDCFLNAQRNAAELRNHDQSLPLGFPSASRQPLSSTTLSGTTLIPVERPTSSATPSLGRRASHAPRTPSPLNPSTSSSSINTNDDGSNVNQNQNSSEGSSASEERRQSQSPGRRQEVRTLGRRGSKHSSALTPMQQLLRQKPAPMRCPESPKQLRDLGVNYSRYPTTSQDSDGHLRSLGSTRFSSTANLLGPRYSVASLTPMNPVSDMVVVGKSGKWGSVDDLSTFNPYNGREKDFILYANEVEDDDDDHMPKEDDDIKFKPKFSDYFNRRIIVSTIGAIFVVVGILCLFIVLPVIYFTGIARMQLPGADYDWWPDLRPPKSWATVNDRNYSLLSSVRRGLIDPETPASAMTRKSSFDGGDLNLVFSDEFNENNRTFYPGDDPYWTAPNIWYGATQDLDWYDPDAVTTFGGTLQLRLDRFPNHNLQYRSGMLNSWNQLCFKGGAFEVSLSLPGPAGVPGLWPGVWSMGNLGRPGYKATTEGVWPYTYNSCDLGITPNQSSPDGLSHLPGQKLPSCPCAGQDHPSPGTGRGAPEIDILEASVDPNNKLGVVTQSFQVAPFDVFYRPNSDFLQIPNYNTTSMNGYCGGPFQQAVSGTTLLNSNWYDGNQYQKYAFEYEPGTSEGKIAWFVGEEQSFMMDGRAIGQNGNVAARVVSEEPMSMVLNLGISPAWGEILFDQLRFPTIMRVDYVRIYQREGNESITCDPPGYPTTDYIKKHPVAYNNPNLTAWNETGYLWPSNQMTSKC